MSKVKKKPKSAKHLRILELRASNFKRLVAAWVRPDGNLIQVTGKNGQGKSSLLDAITAALCGKDAICSQPIRKGQHQAEIELRLGDQEVTLIVRRKFTGDNKTYLTVESKDGAQYRSPQKMLDDLMEARTFDPLAFSRQDAKSQLETLKRLAGLDFSELDRRRAQLFEERTYVNRSLKELDARMRQFDDIEMEAEPVDVEALVLAQDNMRAQQRANDDLRRQVNEQSDVVIQAERRISRVESEIKELQDRIRSLTAELTAERSELKAQAEQLQVLEKEASDIVDPDEEPIKQKLREASEHNRRYDAGQQCAMLASELTAKRMKADALTQNLRKIDDQKRQAIADAAMPVEGLGLGDNCVTFNDLPFDQCSAAERLRISAAVGLALNSTLRVMRIEDGSLLDEDNLAALDAFAAENDCQIFLERVSSSEEGVGIVIEDGLASGSMAVAAERSTPHGHS